MLLAPSKSAIFVDLGPKMAKYGRWRPDTGVTRQPIAVPCSLVTMAAMYGHWLTHLRRICDIPSRRLLSAVLYGETPLGADRAEEVRITDKRKPWYCASHPTRPGGQRAWANSVWLSHDRYLYPATQRQNGFQLVRLYSPARSSSSAAG